MFMNLWRKLQLMILNVYVRGLQEISRVDQVRSKPFRIHQVPLTELCLARYFDRHHANNSPNASEILTGSTTQLTLRPNSLAGQRKPIT
jgi:hypothetical protein